MSGMMVLAHAGEGVIGAVAVLAPLAAIALVLVIGWRRGRSEVEDPPAQPPPD